MSFVIAKKVGHNLLLIGDTKLTDSKILPNQHRPHRAQMVSDPRDGAIKITLINPQLCIAFAGGSITANNAIKICRNLDLDSIINHLRKENNLSEIEIEFIIARGYPDFELIEIKNGKVTRPSELAWIGNPKAFDLYEVTFNELKKSRTHDDSYLANRAFNSVLQSSLIDNVNGFPITVTNETGVFTYQEFMTMEIPPRQIQGFEVITHGTASEGAYSVNIRPTASRSDILPVHILQGNIGILYKSIEGGILMPELIPDTDDFEFSEILLERYGLTARFGITTGEKSYFNRGVKQALKREFTSAISYYHVALSKGSEFTASIYLELAACHFHIGHFEEAIQNANLAQKFNPALRSNASQIIAAINAIMWRRRKG